MNFKHIKIYKISKIIIIILIFKNVKINPINSLMYGDLLFTVIAATNAIQLQLINLI